MRLVEILARELGEWPEGCSGAWQSNHDLEVYLDGSGVEFFAAVAADDRGYPGFGEDGVTREMWEAERVRLAVEKVAEGFKVFHAEGQPDWTGEGLPPVGTEIECWMSVETWTKGKVVAHDTCEGYPVAVCRVLGSYYPFSEKCIRSVSTQRQIEAEERRKGINEMIGILSDAHGDRNSAIAMWEAGYRKQDQQK